MKRADREESRMQIFAKLWMAHGCPEKMTIHVKKTGETITPLNVLTAADDDRLEAALTRVKRSRSNLTVPVAMMGLKRICAGCNAEFIPKSKSSQYCSQRCQRRAARKQETNARRRERERLLAAS